MRFTGKTVLVTGAGGGGALHRERSAAAARRGIGRAVALQFAAEGANVVAVDLNEEALAETLAQIAATTSCRAVAVTGSVTSEEDVDRAFTRAEAEFGGVDVVVNNAGIDDGFHSVTETDPDRWRMLLDVNLSGPFLVARRALPGMIERGAGVIVNITSVASTSGGATGVAYTASKHGLAGLTKSIAVAYGDKGVRCVGVSPGLIRNEVGCDGPGIAQQYRGAGRIGQSHAVNFRSGTPEELSEVVCFVASEQATFVNGAIVAADGGWTAF